MNSLLLPQTEVWGDEETHLGDLESCLPSGVGIPGCCMTVARSLIVCELAWVSCGAAAGRAEVQNVFKKTASKQQFISLGE